MLHGFTVDTIIDTLWLEEQTGQIHIVLKYNSTHYHTVGYIIRPLNQDVSVGFTDNDLPAALARIMSYLNGGHLKFLGTYQDLDIESLIAEKIPGYENKPHVQGYRGGIFSKWKVENVFSKTIFDGLHNSKEL